VKESTTMLRRGAVSVLLPSGMAYSLLFQRQT